VKRTLLALAAFGLMGASAPPPFRIAVLGPTSGPCAAPPASAPAGERAYFDLLKQRMDREVQACPVASFAEGAAGLAAGRLDMALLDDVSYPAVKAVVRPVMTVRPQGSVVRVPVVMAVKAGRDGSPEALKDRTIAFGGSAQVSLALPRQVLVDQGYGEDLAGHELITQDEAAAMTALRSGKADAVALEAAAWQRQCRGKDPKDQPCADLKVAWRARPKAVRALAVRRDLPDPLRYRLLGIHLAMSLENKAAFAWAAAPLGANAANFEPAESQALEAARLP
jgi:ABC-type phosphate/phosphonate transport system substrate-binding protein